MQLVEQHIISSSDKRYAVIDATAFAAKNLYNAALYEMRQCFIHNNLYLPYEQLYHKMKNHEAYKALPAKVSQQVLRLLDKNWQSYFAACKSFREDPTQFLGHPRLPKYKDKQNGRSVLIYTNQAISKRALGNGEIIPSHLPIKVQTKQQKVAQVRIVPRSSFYVVEVIYEKEITPAAVDHNLYAAIDLGLQNLGALTSNKSGFIPQLVNGCPLKSINQFYNKCRAALQAKLPSGRYNSRRLQRITTKRTRRIDHYLHTASRRIVDLLVREGIGTLVIGKNKAWKQEIALGKRNNQSFVQIPHARFSEMLRYKCTLVGIVVIVTEESYTSKCSFLDGESVEKHDTYLGKRVKRGLFVASSGQLINADVNASFNIMRKVAPDAFSKGVADVVVHPGSMAI